MSAYPFSPPLTSVSTVALPTRLLLNPPPTTVKTTASLSLSTPYPSFILPKFSPCPFCSNSETNYADANEDDNNDYDDGDEDVYFDVDDDGFVLSDEKTQSLSEDGVFIEIIKLEGSCRRIRSKIGIEASLDTIWNILTDYEKLSDVIPALTVSKVVEQRHKFARLYQIGQQNLPLGLKFNAKGVIDCYERDLEMLPSGKKREIQFKMIEGDFTVFEGTWLIEQFNEGKCEGEEAFLGEGFQTTLSYLVDLKPKMWLPVRLVESRLSVEIKTNLLSIREEAKRVTSVLNSA